MLLNLLDGRQLKHKYIYIYMYTQINGTILISARQINRYTVKYQKIQHVFKSTSVRSGRRLLVEFTKKVLGHMLQVRSLTVIQTLTLILWLICSGSNRGTVLAKIVITQICEELSKDKRIKISEN